MTVIRITVASPLSENPSLKHSIIQTAEFLRCFTQYDINITYIHIRLV